MAAREVISIFAELRSVVPNGPRRTEGDRERATTLIATIGRYLEESLTDSDLGLILSSLFTDDEDERSILRLLCAVRDGNQFQQFKEQSCKIIASILPRAGKAFAKSKGLEIKRTAALLSRSQESSRVRVEALRLLMAVLRACCDTDAAGDLDVQQLARDVLEKDLASRAPPTVRQQQLHLLGALCQYYPGQMEACSERVCKILLHELELQLASSSAKLEKSIMAGALQGLTCFLHSFSKSPDDDPSTCEKIYKAAIRIINPEADLTRREVQRAGLTLLSTHAAQFAQHLHVDHKVVIQRLLQWSRKQNRDDSRAGLAALDAVLHQLCRRMTEAAAGADTDALAVFSALCAALKRLMDDPSAPPPLLEVAVRGYGSLAEPCRLLRPEELDRLVSWLVERAEHRYVTGEPPTEDQLHQLPGYVWALGSALVQLRTPADAQLAALERLLLLLTELYPRLLPARRPAAEAALAHTLLLLEARPDLADQWLGRLVYQMLLRTCSHPVPVETYLQRDAAVSYAERAVSYQDYVALWDALLAADRLRNLTRRGVTLKSLRALSAAVYRSLMEASLKIIAELNLSTSRPDEPDDAAASGSGDAADGLTAAVPKDFQVFINLVGVLEQMLQSQPAERFEPWLPLFSRRVVADSSLAPLVSGLYRLCRLCLLLADQLGYFTVADTNDSMDTEEASERRELRQLLAAHVADVEVKCRQYRDELQEACVSMVLATPAALAADCAPQLLRVAQVALRLGRGHLPLASRALDSLDRWLPAVMPSCADHLRQIVPTLNQYLSPDAALNVFGSDEDNNHSRATHRRAAVDAKRIAKAEIRSESELAVLRGRVLQLLGALAAAGLVPDGDQQLTAWSRARVLGLAVPFHDLKPTLWLEEFLPRVVEVALSSGDAQARVSACELLHAITIFTIGKGATRGVSGDALQPVYSRLLPALVRLAASPSLTARQLFEPLLTQLSHWFTTDQMAQRPESAALLQALLDGLVDAEDSSRRGLCAQTLREYLCWSLKQQRGGAVQKVAPIMSSLYSYLLHPDPYKRLGGALAFNSVYRVFREDASLLDVYLLETTVALLTALARAHADPAPLGTAEAAAAAVRHCLRMLKQCGHALCQTSADRRVPPGWETATLPRLLSWLTERCGAPQTEFRHMCFHLIVELTPLVPDTGSVGRLLAAAGGPISTFERVLKATYRNASGPVSAGAWLEALLAALDGYSWALGQAACSADVFDGSDSFLLDNVRFLLAEAFAATFGGGLAGPGVEWARLRRLRCMTLVRALAVLEVMLRRAPHLLGGLWQPAICDVLAAAVLAPAELGFDVKEADVLERLPAALADFLREVARAAGPDPVRLLAASLARRVGGRAGSRALAAALQGAVGQPATAQMLQGLRTLSASGFLKQLIEVPPELSVSGDELFRAVWEASVAGPVCSDPGPSARDLAETALTTSLQLGVTPSLLLDCLLPERGGAAADAASERGRLFFLRHSASLAPALLRPDALDAVMVPMVKRAAGHQRGLSLLTALVEQAAADRQLQQSRGAQLAELIAGRWALLAPAPLAARLTLLGSLVRLHAPLAAQPWAEPLVAWFGQLLVDKQPTLDEKKPALRVLPAMLRSPAFSKDVGLLLERLAAGQFPLRAAELAAGSPRQATYLWTVSALCRTAEATAHPALARFLAALLGRELGHPCTDRLRAALQNAVQRRSRDVARQLELAGELYKLCQPGSQESSDCRRTVLLSYLCPLLRAVDRPALLQFFEENIKDIMKAVESPEPAFSTLESEAVEHRWVCRTVSFSLLEVAYEVLPKEFVHAATSPLLTAYAGTTARENALTRAVVKAGQDAFTAPRRTEKEAPGLAAARCRCLCALYNALVAVIVRTQTEARFYNGLLFEVPSKGRVIWERLVDLERQYQFPLNRPSPQQKWSAASQRRDAPDLNETEQQTSAQRSVLQFLADSSLSSQVTRYDFNSSVVLDTQEVAALAAQQGERPAPAAAPSSPALDELDEHECMETLSRLVKHMVHSVEPPPRLGQPAGPASWLTEIIARLESPDTPGNVLLFLVRLVASNEAELKPYADWLLGPLLRLAAAGRLGAELDSLILDLVTVFAVWARLDDIAPRHEERVVAGALLDFVIRRAPHGTRSIVRHVTGLFSLLVADWGDRAVFPGATVCQLLDGDRAQHSQLAAVGALSAALENDRPLELTDDEYARVLKKVLALLQTSSADIYKPASRVVAFMCARIVGNEGDETAQERQLEAARSVLRQLEKSDWVRWVTCLSQISPHCRQLAVGERTRLLYVLPSLYGREKALGLQVLHDVLDGLPDLHRELSDLALPQLIQSREHPLVLWSLKVLLRASQKLGAEEFRSFLPSIGAAVSQGDAESRKVAVELCIELRKRFRSDGSEAGRAVADVATDSLLTLLTDSDPTIRQTAANHWADGVGLEDTTPGRLGLVLTTMFRPGLEASYLSYSTYLLLGLASRSPDYSRQMFDRALPECQFQEQHIVNSWRVQSTAVVPLFSQPAAAAGSGLPALVRATQQNLAFTPTQRPAAAGATVDWLTQTIATPTAAELSAAGSLLLSGRPRTGAGPLAYADYSRRGQPGDEDAGVREEVVARILRRRFETDPRQVSARLARLNADQRALRDERQQERTARQDAKASLLRTYRRGELPDTEIPYSDLLRPLQALAMHDPPTARRLLVGLLTGTLHELASDQPTAGPGGGAQPAGAADGAAATLRLPAPRRRRRDGENTRRDRLLASAEAGLVGTLRRLRTPDAGLVSAVLLAALENGLELPAPLLESVCKSSGQLPAGVLLLERALEQLEQEEASEPPRKQSRSESGDRSRQDANQLWTALAELYRELGDWDSARAALARRADLPREWADALDAEARGDYRAAVCCYEKTLKQTDDVGEDSYFQCLSELSNWSRLEQNVDQWLTLDGGAGPDLSAVWATGSESGKDLLLSWLVRCKTRLAIESGGDSRAARQIIDFVRGCGDNRHVLEDRFPEELALLKVLDGQLEWARYYCDAAKTVFLRDWSAASASGGQSRKLLLQQLRRITELQEYLSVMSETASVASAAVLLERWERRLPTSQETFSFWDGVVARRELYGGRLTALLPADGAARLQRHLCSARLRLVEAALDRRNYPAAVVHLERLRAGQLGAADDPELHAEYRLLRSRAQLVAADDSDKVVKARRALDKHVPWSSAEDLPLALLLRRARLEAELAERLAELAAPGDDSVRQFISGSEPADSAAQLAFGRLAAAAETAAERQRHTPLAAEASLEVVKFCSRQLEHQTDGDDPGLAARLRTALVDSTLAAMAAGATDAADWLPRLLLLADRHEDAARALREKWATPPAWMYLGWLPLLLSYAGSAGAGPAVRPLLEQLAAEYPQAVVYPVMLCRAGAARPALLDAFLQRLEELLKPQQLPVRLVDELERLLAAVRQQAASGEEPLQKYSDWLATFQDLGRTELLEVPGQYSGRRRPTPDYHVHIANFGQQVLVLPSKERPVRLTVRGDDALEYRYLVKGGDDLRTDERLQQLFGIINGRLAVDPQTVDRRLALRTYRVLPMKPKLGLIQWLDGTETLRGFLSSSCDSFDRQAEAARNRHLKQLQEKAPSAGNVAVLHDCYVRTPRDKVVEEFGERRGIVGGRNGRPSQTLLRDALFRLSRSPEAFLQLRTNLAVSHALMSAAGWLLGVGDRHLSNFLVSLEDGSLIAIDFGFAFGEATHLRVPEVVPFRLTPQLAGVTAPLGPAGLTRQTMVHVLQALRRSHQLLTATLEVLVQEPTVDWTERTRKADHAPKHGARAAGDSAQQRVRAVRRRLAGGHPAVDVCELLESSTLPPDLAAVWRRVARGRPGLDPRADLADCGLTVEDQVKCLLDLAMDPYVLGLAFYGWEAHV